MNYSQFDPEARVAAAQLVWRELAKTESAEISDAVLNAQYHQAYHKSSQKSFNSVTVM